MKFKHEMAWTNAEGGHFAISPTHEDGVVVWFNTHDRQRAYDLGKVTHDEEDRFSFVDDRGRSFTLRPLTVEKYRDLKEHLVQPPDLRTHAQLEAHFLGL